MYNTGRNHYSHGRPGSESYPTSAPNPQVDNNGIPTPPNAPHHHPIPLPPRVWNNVPQPYLHPLLRYSHHPSISYDVRHPPSYASAPNTRLEWAHEPATNPSSPEIIITCHPLPHPFIVRPFGKHYDFVTIHDILLAVHREFSEVIQATENNSSRPGKSGETELLLTGEIGLSNARSIWKGLSEEKSPGNWLLHIE
ncbi:hypothetical protein F5887DRAFT_1009387 [Amanita rubescens]|nr:hypothetical protein F5887DRAFT_1009387 [Amanita rubescens]